MQTTAPRPIVAVKTGVFRIHNPSRRKRAMLDHALLHNHLAYSKALKVNDVLLRRLVAEELAERSRTGPKDGDAAKRARERKFARERELARRVSGTIASLPICSAAKAARSLPGTLIGQLESHIELHGKQDNVGFPTVQPLKIAKTDWNAALESVSAARTVEEENEARDRLARLSKAGQLRPLLFAVNRKSDGFLLLRDETKNRFFVWLNLVPERSRFATLTARERAAVSCRGVRGLTNLRTGEVVSFRSKTGCLFPIEFGRDYQAREFLDQGSPLSAKLLKRDGGYEVHIAFEFKHDAVQPRVFLGVDRGIYNLASLAVVDENGKIAERRNLDGRGLRFVQRVLERRQRDRQKRGKIFTGRSKRHAADEAVHTAANGIVALAEKHGAQVVMENLAPLAHRGGKRGRSNFNRVLNRSQYQKLEKVLHYKLAARGLPKPRQVHPAYTSQACPTCGHIDAKNRVKAAVADGFRMHEFKCVRCGFGDDADLNAARNIALKMIWRGNLSPALRKMKFAEVPEYKNFSSFLENRAERRGERACDSNVGTFGRAGLDGQYEDGEVPPGGNADPRSGSNTPAGKNSSAMLPAVSPSDENPRPPTVKTRDGPDG
jgi:IS605 OrfB family transposase